MRASLNGNLTLQSKVEDHEILRVRITQSDAFAVIPGVGVDVGVGVGSGSTQAPIPRTARKIC